MSPRRRSEPLFDYVPGDGPLVISFPHSGTYVPPELAARLRPEARNLPDTDWFVPQLYDFFRDLDASVIRATHTRYVVDLNRPPDGAPLYPGQRETTVCPTESFSGEALYADGGNPAPAEIAERLQILPYRDDGRAGRIECDGLDSLSWQVGLFQYGARGGDQRPQMIFVRLRGVVRVLALPMQRIFVDRGADQATIAVDQRNPNAQCAEINSRDNSHPIHLLCCRKLVRPYGAKSSRNQRPGRFLKYSNRLLKVRRKATDFFCQPNLFRVEIP